jgi:hypothetical protein
MENCDADLEEQCRMAEEIAKKKQPLVKGKKGKIFDSANYELEKSSKNGDGKDQPK